MLRRWLEVEEELNVGRENIMQMKNGALKIFGAFAVMVKKFGMGNIGREMMVVRKFGCLEVFSGTAWCFAVRRTFKVARRYWAGALFMPKYPPK